MPEAIQRTFVAIAPDEPLRLAIGRVQAQWKRQVPEASVKWAGTHAMHVTLQFLGDTPAQRLGEITEALRQAAAGIPSLEIGVEGRGCFPDCRRPRVLWLGVLDPGQPLHRLRAAVARHLAPFGWPDDVDDFTPHVTLGRLARGAGRPQVEAVGRLVAGSVVERVGVQRVTEVHLFRSDQGREGHVHRVVATLPLQPA